MLSQNKFWLTVLVVLLIAVAGYFTGELNFSSVSGQSSGSRDEFSATTSPITLNPKSDSGEVAIESVPIKPAESAATLPVPNLDFPLVFPADFSVEAKSIFEAKINAIRSNLKNHPKVEDDWLSLGINLKAISNLEQARIAWEYAAYLDPRDPVPLSNLGDLFGYYLKQPVAAEKYFRQAIAVEPYMPFWYQNLANFYREVIGDLTRAKLTLEQGLARVQDDNLEKSLKLVNDLIAQNQQ